MRRLLADLIAIVREPLGIFVWCLAIAGFAFTARWLFVALVWG